MRNVRQEVGTVGARWLRNLVKTGLAPPVSRSSKHKGIPFGNQKIHCFENRSLSAVILSDEQIDPLQTR